MRLKFLIVFVVSILLFSSSKNEYIINMELSYEGEWHSEPLADDNGVEFEMYINRTGLH